MGAGDTEDAGGARSDTVMLVNIPANRKRVVAVSFPRDLAITPMQCEPWNPETGEYGPLYDEETGIYGPDEVYTETKLNSAYAVRRPEVPGEGDPEAVRPVHQPVHGSRFRRLLQDGRRARRCRGLQHHAAGGLRARHRAGHRRPADRRRPHRTELRARPPGDHRDQRRLRPHQAPAAVPVVAAALADLQGNVLLAVSKLNNVVNMFIDDSYVDNINTKDLVDLGQSMQGVNAGRITFVTVPTAGYADEYGNETRATDDMRALFDAIINDDPLPEEKNADNTPVPGTPESRPPSADRRPGSRRPARWSTRSPPTRRTSPCRCRTRPARPGWRPPPPANCRQHGFNVDDSRRLPGPAVLDHGVLLAGQRAGRRDGRLVVRRRRPSSG